MTIKVPCGERSGCVKVPASKSWAHRMLITAALSAEKSELMCDGISNDISATIKCLNAMGAYITISEAGTVSDAAAPNTGNMVIHVSPIKKIIDHSNERALYAPLLCGESGSTLRFLIPIAGALGINAAFQNHSFILRLLRHLPYSFLHHSEKHHKHRRFRLKASSLKQPPQQVL